MVHSFNIWLATCVATFTASVCAAPAAAARRRAVPAADEVPWTLLTGGLAHRIGAAVTLSRQRATARSVPDALGLLLGAGAFGRLDTFAVKIAVHHRPPQIIVTDLLLVGGRPWSRCATVVVRRRGVAVIRSAWVDRRESIRPGGRPRSRGIFPRQGAACGVGSARCLRRGVVGRRADRVVVRLLRRRGSSRCHRGHGAQEGAFRHQLHHPVGAFVWVCGVLFWSGRCVAVLRQLHASPPLRRCLARERVLAYSYTAVQQRQSVNHASKSESWSDLQYSSTAAAAGLTRTTGLFFHNVNSTSS